MQVLLLIFQWIIIQQRRVQLRLNGKKPVTYQVHNNALFVWKCLHSSAPVYLNNPLSVYHRNSRLRKLYDATTLTPTMCKKVVGQGVFGYSGPNLWNNYSPQKSASLTQSCHSKNCLNCSEPINFILFCLIPYLFSALIQCLGPVCFTGTLYYYTCYIYPPTEGGSISHSLMLLHFFGIVFPSNFSSVVFLCIFTRLVSVQC